MICIWDDEICLDRVIFFSPVLIDSLLQYNLVLFGKNDLEIQIIASNNFQVLRDIGFTNYEW